MFIPLLNRVIENRSLRQKTLFFIGMVLVILFIYPVADGDRFLKKVDYKVFDLFVNGRAQKAPDKNIVIVDIDDESIKAVGQWPWPRYKTAMVLKNIKNGRAAAVGIDILFPEKDETSLDNMQNTFRHDFGLNLNFDNIPDGLKDNDGYMSHILSEGPFILSDYFYFNGLGSASCQMRSPKITGFTGKEKFYNGMSVLCSLNRFNSSVSGTGFINAVHDEDGIMRRVPLIISYRDKPYPSMPLMVFNKAFANSTIALKKSLSGMVMKTGDTVVPLNSDGTAMINFRNSSYKYISAADVYYDQIKPSEFTGKIVIVGSSATGMNDLHSTSLKTYLPGLEVHATIIDNLINRDFLSVPAWSPEATIFGVFLFGLISAYLSSRSKSLELIIIIPSMGIGVALFSFILFYFKGIYISPTAPVMAVCIIWVFLTAINFFMEEKMNEMKTLVLAETQAATIRSMASVAETRDPETGQHIYRTQHYIRLLAQYLFDKGMYADELDRPSIETLYLSAPLHDIGKVGIPDNILLKPGKLTTDEFEIMKTHTVIGEEIIKRVDSEISDSSFLRFAKIIAISHHEKWDGTGYPKGLKGADIPLAGRLMAIADVYDALVSKRHYKASMTHETACAIIISERGTHFDPDLVDAFIELGDKMLEIAEKYKDEPES